MSAENEYRLAPPGFTAEQWEIFNRDGIIFIEDALDQGEIGKYREAVDRACRRKENYAEGD